MKSTAHAKFTTPKRPTKPMENLDQGYIHSDKDFVDMRASHGRRLLNYIIDTILIYVLAIAVFVFFDLLGIFTIGIEGNEVLDSLIGLAVFYAYYFALEASLGLTIGKMITGTMVIDNYGQKPTAASIALRTLCRFVPFEQFSILYDPNMTWHDKWSKTQTVERKHFNV